MHSTQADTNKCVMGTRDLNLGARILEGALKAWNPKGQDPAETVASFFEETAPQNPLEAMLIAQMAAAHAHAMDIFTEVRNTTMFDIEVSKLKLAEKLMRTFANSLDVLERVRRKGRQSVKVEHIHINAGAQAIIGNVSKGGGSSK